jgi:hypothetical protein
MEIPREFKIGKRSYSVQMPKRLRMLGRVFPSIGLIYINKERNGLPRTHQDMAETFWHEVTHGILFDMKDKRWRNEPFVTEFSKRLNQVVQTAKLKG